MPVAALGDIVNIVRALLLHHRARELHLETAGKPLGDSLGWLAVNDAR